MRGIKGNATCNILCQLTRGQESISHNSTEGRTPQVDPSLTIAPPHLQENNSQSTKWTGTLQLKRIHTSLCWEPFMLCKHTICWRSLCSASQNLNPQLLSVLSKAHIHVMKDTFSPWNRSGTAPTALFSRSLNHLLTTTVTKLQPLCISPYLSFSTEQTLGYCNDTLAYCRPTDVLHLLKYTAACRWRRWSINIFDTAAVERIPDCYRSHLCLLSN